MLLTIFLAIYCVDLIPIYGKEGVSSFWTLFWGWGDKHGTTQNTMFFSTLWY